MKLPEDGMLLRIFVGEEDMFESKPLYEWITYKARELNIAGATVLRGVMGYGATSRMHSAKVLRMSEDLPLVIEIVDTEEKLNLLLPHLDQAVTEGMMTMEKVRVIKYRHADLEGI